MGIGKSLLAIRKQGSVAIVSFLTPGILDQASVNSIGNEMMELVEKEGWRRMLIDLSAVKYLSSSMVGRFIALHKKMVELEGEIKLCSIDPSIYEIFETMRLDKVFDIHPDEPSAMAAFEGEEEQEDE